MAKPEPHTPHAKDTTTHAPDATHVTEVADKHYETPWVVGNTEKIAGNIAHAMTDDVPVLSSSTHPASAPTSHAEAPAQAPKLESTPVQGGQAPEEQRAPEANIDWLRNEYTAMIKEVFGLPVDCDITRFHPFADHKKEFWNVIKAEQPWLVNKFLDFFSKKKRTCTAIRAKVIECAYTINKMSEAQSVTHEIEATKKHIKALLSPFNEGTQAQILEKIGTQPAAFKKFLNMGETAKGK